MMIGVSMRTLAGLLAGALSMLAPWLAQKPVKHQLMFDGHARVYQVFVPPPVESDRPPMIVLLHGSGRDGSSLLLPWEPLARKEHIVLVAIDSLDRDSWSLATDGPDLIRQVVEAAADEGHVDRRRVYLFGHSAGGHHSLDLALLESEYFAAAAVHAGVLTFQPESRADAATRKIPLALWSGTDDRVVPIAAVRSTVDLLKTRGFPVLMNEMPRHTHDYYGSADQVNKAAWQFLKGERLTSDPKFKDYIFKD